MAPLNLSLLAKQNHRYQKKVGLMYCYYLSGYPTYSSKNKTRQPTIPKEETQLTAQFPESMLPEAQPHRTVPDPEHHAATS